MNEMGSIESLTSQWEWPTLAKGRRKRTFARFKMDMQLFKQTSYGGILQEDEFVFADHDMLMPITNVIGVIRPFLRRFWPHDVHGLRRFTNPDDRPLRTENHDSRLP